MKSADCPRLGKEKPSKAVERDSDVNLCRHLLERILNLTRHILDLNFGKTSRKLKDIEFIPDLCMFFTC